MTKPKSLVTVGSSSLDTENLDEINLNASTEETAVTSDANANPLWDQQTSSTSDSILSQAASSFSALPSVASNVFSSFSKRISGISSRETTPGHDTSSSASDPNGNSSNVPQLDIQPNYTQHQQEQQQFPQQQQYQYPPANQPPFQTTPQAAQPFYAPPLPPPTAGSQAGAYGYFEGSVPPSTTGLEAITNTPNLPPAEPPKFYTPAEVPSAPPTAAVPPPSTGGGQNNFRFTAKKKLYAPIPGLSDQQSGQAPPAATVTGPIPPAPFPTQDPYSQTPSYPYEERKSEERKSGGGLFSKITQLAPSGVLQNITGLVQSAAGTITQTINPNSQSSGNNNGDQQYQQPPTVGNFGIQFDQQQQYQAGAGYPLPPPPATNYFGAPNYSGEPQANYTPPPPATSEAISTIPQPQSVAFFNPQAANVPALPPSGDVSFFNPSAAAPPTIFDPFKQQQQVTQASESTPQPTQRPPSASSRPPSHAGTGAPPPASSSVAFFNPLQQPQPSSADTQAGVNFFNPSAAPPTIFDPFKQTANPTEPPRPARPSSRPYNNFSEVGGDQQQLRPPSAGNQQPSSTTSEQVNSPQPPLQFFNPSQVPSTGGQPPSEQITTEASAQPLPSGPPPVQFFNPLLQKTPSQPPLEAQQTPLRPPSNQAATQSENPLAPQSSAEVDQPTQPPAAAAQSASGIPPVQFFNPLSVQATTQPHLAATTITGEAQQPPLRPPSNQGHTHNENLSASQTSEKVSQTPAATGPVQFFNPLQVPLGPSAATQNDSSSSQVAPTSEPVSQPPAAVPVPLFNPLQAAFGGSQPPLPTSSATSATQQPLRPPSTSNQTASNTESVPQAPVQFFNPLQEPAVNRPSILPPTSSTLRPPSATSQPSDNSVTGQQPPIPFFNPLQAAGQLLQQPAVGGVPPPVNFYNPLQAGPAAALPPQPVSFFDPSLAATTQQTKSIAAPPSSQQVAPPPSTEGAAAVPPPPSGSTSYRLQKGTKLYKNPLTAQETAPAQALPNPAFGVAPPTLQTYPQTTAIPPPGPQIYQPYNQGFPGPVLTPVANIFTPSSEAKSEPLFAPTTAEVPHKVEESQQQIEPNLVVPTTQELPVGQSEQTQSVPQTSQTPSEISQEIQTQESLQQQHPTLEPVNPDYFFKPIEPAAGTQEQSSDSAQDLCNPIEPVAEPIQETQHQQEELQKATEPEQQSSNQVGNFFGQDSDTSQNFFKPIEPVLETNPPDHLEQALENLSLEPANVAAPPLAPPPTQLGAGSSNPYRRGSNASEANKPVKTAPSLANFFTPSTVATGGGDFNFFASLPSQTDNSNNSTANFFSSQTTEQQTTSNVEESELKEPTAPVEEQLPAEPTTPYPTEQTTGPSFPALPTNQGIIPVITESAKDLNRHQEQKIKTATGPIGFEAFNPTFGHSQGTSTPNFFDNNQQQATIQAQVPPPTGFENQNATQTQPQQQQQQLEASANPITNSFTNFFNQSVTATVGQAENNTCSSFFDNFSGQQQVQQQQTSAAIATTAAAANEEQRIQNFFNNPPPKDADHVGDLNYDLVHSGLAIRNLQQRSLTPVSNLVEPPSSACSEFSTLNASEVSIVREDNKTNEVEAVASNTTAAAPSDNSSITKHYEELPEEILRELRMANMLQSDKPSTPVAGTSYKPAVKHWFYKRTIDAKQVWVPFSHYDSALLETSLLEEGEGKPEVVAVEGGRYDVYIKERLKRSVYWESEPIEVRRCSWFYKAVDSKYIPYEESTADVLEAEYKQAAESGVWHKTIILGMGEQVVFHGPTVIVHFQQQQNQDAWGGTTQTTTRPRVVKRDLDDFNITQGESQKVDHLLFMVHGIGSACDLKLRTVEEVVEDFRTIAHQLVQSHYKNSTDLGLVGRVEVLPISWHSQLHSIELGIDEKLRSITLESIPKLRNFTNDTLLDILFYTSPTFCQRIMNSIVMSLNDMYMKYRQRHPDFNGGVSLAGHSLGSLILFDLLCHQNPIKESEEKNLENPDQQFLSQSNLAAVDSNNQMEAKSISYTMGPAGTGQPFINYGQLIFQPKKFFALGSPVGMFVTIRGIDKLGLDFRLPTCPGFYNIFHPYDPVAYRIEALVNPDLSGVRPVLIPHHKGRKRMHLELKETMARVSTDLKHRFLDKFKNTFDSVNFFGPLASKSKKETEEMMEKEVQKVIEMQMQMEHQRGGPSTSGGSQQQSQSQTPNQEHMSPGDEPQSSSSQHLPLLHAPRARTDSVSTAVSDDMVEIDFPLGKLNDSKRIDYVLQEAPLEFINEYIFALSSHVCYWDSEDTILFVMKEIYAGLGISPDSQVPQQTMTIERPSSRNSLSQA
ncbi:phosphatidic Acid Phospholipase A1 isoform X2 [Musca autumnalis]|uniref:phosphatidic Acid Phospholipase A1 isoform X2 n=1 Tax=Musca autumnalis TaxID=221902 RepID=UPI003CEC9387